MIYYPLIIALQAFCVFHAYKNNSEQKWYWLIIFFPLLGCGIYLYHHFYSRENVKIVSEGLKGSVNKNYQIEKLENKVNFSDSVLNKTMLADKYLETNEYEKAIELYDSCLKGFDKGNVDTIQKIIHCYFSTKNYEKAVFWGEKIKNNREFHTSVGHVSYAWSLFHLNETEKAEDNFKLMDASYSNFSQRIEYSKFLYQINKQKEARDMLEEVSEEFDQLDSYSKKHYKGVKKKIETALWEMDNSQ